MNKQIITITILVILLVVSLGFIFQDKYIEQKVQQGASLGYQQAKMDIIQMAVTCQQVPVRIGNQTINLIAVECLQNG